MSESDSGIGNGSGGMDVDPVFATIPKNKTCLCVWRVENFKLVAVPRESFGIFFKGDAYVIYHAEEIKKSTNTLSTIPATVVQHIHFWIGSEATQDEAGVAAYKTVELDDHLSGNAVQHREVQGNESERFLSYFKSRGGVTYRQGGIASGFHRHQSTNEPRLFRLKGRHTVRLYEMPSIDWSYISRGDVYLLDLTEVIFLWNGAKSNKYERLQAMQRARQLRDERGKANIVIIEDGEEMKMHKDELKLFESKLLLKDKNTKLSLNDTMDENDDDKRLDGAHIKLYKCSDENGTLKVTEKKTGPLIKTDLESEDAYIVDNGTYGIWVWVGRRSNPKERREAMRNALGFLQKKGYPKSTKVCRVIDGAEPMEFIALFKTWMDSNGQKGLGKTYTKGHIAKMVSSQFDAVTMHSHPQLAAATQMPDDGSGKKEIFRIEQFKMIPYPESMHGIFFSGDSFIIQYTYHDQQRPFTLIYFWLGHYSSIDEQGAAAIGAVELDKKINGTGTIIRVVQDKEPLHFMAMFHGQMIIFKHGKRSGFRNLQYQDENTSENEDCYLLQVRGLSKYDTKAVQVDLRATSLNSSDCFVLFTPQSVYIWCGKGSTGDEREMSKVVASSKSKEPSMVFEGQEKDEFWNHFPYGKEPYASDKRIDEHQSSLTSSNDHPARLYEISNASGYTTAIEITNFTQADLDEDDVMLLDAWTSIFLWIGRNANKTEMKDAEQIAYNYLRTDPSHRDPDTPIIKTKQMYEPVHFTGFFGPWDRDYWTSKSSYETTKSMLHADNRSEIYAELIRDKPKQNISNRTTVNKYPYDLLLKPADELPEDVNPELREIHLNDDEFLQRFKLTYAEYASKPAWRQKELKKMAKLF
ncbi:unnamed protein product [Adineta steineri]|uniref:HP domain-containing protein n=1 Tax=Adineta steineri TaxID=433720 RepID=A0A819CEY4_9BILA|nr:unnamed protein product [Adineta steineri]CAF3818145.1 unnamed protein product [Adineta steineri]